MKRINFTQTGMAMLLLFLTHFISCTLTTEVREPTVIPASVGDAPAAPDLVKVYQALRVQDRIFDINELTSDIAAGPTRGTDWYDGGVRQQYQLHTWAASHAGSRNAWNDINSSIYNATLIAESTTATEQTKAEGKFIRALASYLSCDIYGQVQRRPATAAVDAFRRYFCAHKRWTISSANWRKRFPTCYLSTAPIAV